MSVIGPRPVTLAETYEYGDAREEVLSCKPGITGWWAVTDRNNSTWQSGQRQARELWRDAESIVGGETYVCFLKSLQNNRPMLVLYEVSRLSEWTSGSAKGYGLSDAVSGAPTTIAYPRQML